MNIKQKESILLKMSPLLAAFFINGMIAVMTGIVLKYIYIENGIGYEKIGVSIAIQSISNMIGGMISSPLIKKFGKKSVLALFCVLFSSFGLLIFANSFYFVLIVMAITGIAWGLCNNLVHVLLIGNYGDDEASISALHTSYAVGSFVGPFIIVLFSFMNIGWRFPVILIFIGSIALIPFLFKVNTNLNKAKTNFNKAKTILNDADIQIVNIPKTNTKLLKDKGFIICVLLYFAYIGIEVSINAWLPVFLEYDKHFPSSLAQLGISIVWLTIIFSRLLCILLRKRMRNHDILAYQCIGLLITLIIVIVSLGTIFTFISLVLLGFVMGGISPSNAENAKSYLTENSASSGIIFAGGGLGSMLLPLLIGFITGKSTVFYGMLCILFFSAFIMLIAIFNKYYKSKDNVSY